MYMCSLNPLNSFKTFFCVELDGGDTSPTTHDPIEKVEQVMMCDAQSPSSLGQYSEIRTLLLVMCACLQMPSHIAEKCMTGIQKVWNCFGEQL